MVTLLSGEYPPGDAEELCVEVLGTLRALTAGNEACRAQLEAVVGHDALGEALLRCQGGEATRGVMLQVRP